jgi:hypothetical protein
MVPNLITERKMLTSFFLFLDSMSMFLIPLEKVTFLSLLDHRKLGGEI